MSEFPKLGPVIYEGGLLLPWIQPGVIHKPGDSYARTTVCGIYIGKDNRVRLVSLHETDPYHHPCERCFP